MLWNKMGIKTLRNKASQRCSCCPGWHVCPCNQNNLKSEEVDLQRKWICSAHGIEVANCQHKLVAKMIGTLFCRVSKHLSKVSNVHAQSSVDNWRLSSTPDTQTIHINNKSISECQCWHQSMLHFPKWCENSQQHLPASIKDLSFDQIVIHQFKSAKVTVWSPAAWDPHIQRTAAVESSPKMHGKSSDSTLHTPNLTSIWTSSNWSSKDSQKNHSDWQQHPSSSPHAKESNQKRSVPVCVFPLWRWAQNASPSCLVSSFFLQSTKRWNLTGGRF